MDPFFKAISSALGVMVIFFISIVGGRFIASMTAKSKESRQLVTGLAAVALFLLLFFGTRT